jgi:ribosomal protein S18 acetylase RimI-like enzyme
MWLTRETRETLVVAVEDVTAQESRRLVTAYVAEIEQRWRTRTATDVAAGRAVPAGSPPPEAAEATLVPPDGLFLVARRDGKAVGCVGLRRLAADVGEVKRMYVPPEARGTGVARHLLAAVEAQAVQRGFAQLRLDTRRDLVEAQQLYRSAGYREIPRYNENPYAEHWFEKSLGGHGPS